jgi:hypothetical protein
MLPTLGLLHATRNGQKRSALFHSCILRGNWARRPRFGALFPVPGYPPGRNPAGHLRSPEIATPRGCTSDLFLDRALAGRFVASFRARRRNGKTVENRQLVSSQRSDRDSASWNVFRAWSGRFATLAACSEPSWHGRACRAGQYASR